MTAKLPQDQNATSVQVLSPSNPVNVAIGTASASAALPSDSTVVRVTADVACWIAFGKSGVAATTSSVYFPAGAESFAVPTGVTHIAVIQSSSAGTLNVSKMS